MRLYRNFVWGACIAVLMLFAQGGTTAAEAASAHVCPLGQSCYDTDDGPASLQTACQWYFGLPLQSQPQELTIEILDGVTVHCTFAYSEFETDESTIEILDHHHDALARLHVSPFPRRTGVVFVGDRAESMIEILDAWLRRGYNIVWGS